MNDLISRRAAIAEAYNVVIDGSVFKVVQVETLYGLPTIEPKRGKWKIIKGVLHPLEIDGVCSICDYATGNYHFYNYCPHCGAEMCDDDLEEPKINPCRGCDDYDGRGGCKSHCACVAERSEE